MPRKKASRLILPDHILDLNPGLVELTKGRSVSAGTAETLIAPGCPIFKSDTERRAWLEWVPTLEGVLKVLYEPLTLHLSVEGLKVRSYKPDLFIRFFSARPWFVEVKRTRRLPSERAQVSARKHAAIEFAWLADFYLLMLEQGSLWSLERIL